MSVLKYWDASTSTYRILSGPVGPTGATGPIGPTGPTGAAVLSADANNYSRLGSDNYVYTPANDFGRNKLHNALFRVWQRGVGPFTTNVYTADRWGISFATDTVSVSQQGFAVGGLSADEEAVYVLTNTFTGNSAAGAYTTVYQRMEDVRRLSNKTVTVSFWAAVNSGTATKIGVSVDQYFGTGGSPSAVVNNPGQSVTLTSNYTRYSLTFPLASIAGKVLGTNNDHGTYLYLWYSSGATFNSRAGNIGVQAGQISIWGVQLEVGTVATPLEKLDYALDLMNCKRFYQIGQLISGGYGSAGATVYWSSQLTATMRAVPTMTVANVTQTNCGTLSIGAYNANSIWMSVAVTAAGMYIQSATFTASADL